MKQVFSSNYDLFHVYAQQGQNFGRANSVTFNGSKCFSYAQCIGNIQGNNCFLINWNYSVTTGKHNSYLQSATSHYNQIFVYDPEDPESQRNTGDFISRFDELLVKLTKSRKPSIYLREIKQLQKTVINYLDAIGCEKPELNKILEFTPENSEKVKAEIKERLVKEKKIEIERVKQELKDFKNFKRDYLHRSDFAYLRVNESEVETSKGVKVKIDLIKPLVMLYKSFIDGKTELKDKLIGRHIDYYTINGVNENFVTIGCHKIPKDEILSIAK